jgi:hypothetical protein
MKLRKFVSQQLYPKSDFTSSVMNADFPSLRGLLYRAVESIYRILDGIQNELEKIINVGISEELSRHLSGSKAWEPGEIADNGSASTTVTVTGAVAGSPCFAGYSGITSANWDIYALVTSADTVSVRIVNRTGGALTPTGTLSVDVWAH